MTGASETSRALLIVGHRAGWDCGMSRSGTGTVIEFAEPDGCAPLAVVEWDSAGNATALIKGRPATIPDVAAYIARGPRR